MLSQPITHTINRYRTLHTHKIYALPIVILMPHSACNCRCVMCDIWKDNKNLKQLTESDVNGLLASLKKFGTRQVVMSGGEALLNTNFFRLCEILKNNGLKISLLSTGLLVKKHTEQLLRWVDDIIVSLDGDETTHDNIRNVKGAFERLAEGVQAIKAVNPLYKITGRTVIHRLNYLRWPMTIEAAKKIGLNQISFLPADVSSHAFNREVLWTDARQHDILLGKHELPVLQSIIDMVVVDYAGDFENGFIAESPAKLRKLYEHYAAFYGLNNYPYKKCNAPWVSAVIEADGSVRPCFFHPSIGNIRDNPLDEILNSKTAIQWRKELDIDTNETCAKCVCYLNLQPRSAIQ